MTLGNVGELAAQGSGGGKSGGGGARSGSSGGGGRSGGSMGGMRSGGGGRSGGSMGGMRSGAGRSMGGGTSRPGGSSARSAAPRSTPRSAPVSPPSTVNRSRGTPQGPTATNRAPAITRSPGSLGARTPEPRTATRSPQPRTANRLPVPGTVRDGVGQLDRSPPGDRDAINRQRDQAPGRDQVFDRDRNRGNDQDRPDRDRGDRDRGDRDRDHVDRDRGDRDWNDRDLPIVIIISFAVSSSVQASVGGIGAGILGSAATTSTTIARTSAAAFPLTTLTRRCPRRRKPFWELRSTPA